MGSMFILAGYIPRIMVVRTKRRCQAARLELAIADQGITNITGEGELLGRTPEPYHRSHSGHPNSIQGCLSAGRLIRFNS